MNRILKDNYLVFLLVALFMAGFFIRPALPVDETRYLTAAWELWLSGSWAKLTVNFEPYHHKPPLLFWMINIFWSVFGISRWAATLPAVFSSLAVIFLSDRLARALFKDDESLRGRLRLLILGSAPFLIYGSLIMFDMMLTVFVLAALLCLIEYARGKKALSLLGFGLCMGFGVLTKGPVVYLHVLLPALLAPFWAKDLNLRWPAWYGACLSGVLVSAAPVMLWLVPLLLQSDKNFIHWLLWEQTAGRVTGSFNNAHGRPVYFYLPLVPLFFMPWILFPGFWRALKARRGEMKYDPGLRFLFFWVVPGFIAFSLISGKQPHYLVPFVPGALMFTAWVMRDVKIQTLRNAVLGMFALFVVGHGVAFPLYFHLYDWRPIATYVGTHQDKPWAYVRNYNGEIGFLGRMEHPMFSTNLKDLPAWFAEHPDGMAVVRYKKAEEVAQYDVIMTIPYRVNHYASILKPKP